MFEKCLKKTRKYIQDQDCPFFDNFGDCFLKIFACLTVLKLQTIYEAMRLALGKKTLWFLGGNNISE